MKIMRIGNKYINTDHIVCYDVQQTDREPERIISCTVYLDNDKQLEELFFTKTSKFSSLKVKEKLVERFCYDDAEYISFHDVCDLLEGQCS